jgi:hypothetical protein
LQYLNIKKRNSLENSQTVDKITGIRTSRCTSRDAFPEFNTFEGAEVWDFYPQLK